MRIKNKKTKEICLALLCMMICTVLCMSSCTGKPDGAAGTAAGPSVTESGAPSEDDEPSTPYAGIIERYIQLLNTRASNGELPAPQESSGRIETVLYNVVSCSGDPASMGYATKDINEDGIKELLLLDRNSKLYALFTMIGGSPSTVMELWDASAAITSDGTLYVKKRVQNNEETVGEYTYVKKLADGALVGFEYGDNVVDGVRLEYYKVVDGQRIEITKEENSEYDRVMYTLMTDPRRVTKNGGFRFIPALGAAETNAPAADFSSYSAILDAYRVIVQSLPDYTQQDWMDGKYDGLFAFSTDEEYEIFHQIFTLCRSELPRSKPYGSEYASDAVNAYGYAEKDLNGDGTDELILLSDNYNVIALFTMRDGRAVHLAQAGGCRFDPDGMIVKRTMLGLSISYGEELYVYRIDGTELECIVGAGCDYLLDDTYRINGAIHTEISKEEWQELHERYAVTPRGYSSEECTRMVLGGEFTPLVARTSASEVHINVYGNMTFIGGDTLSVSGVTGDNVAFGMKFVTTSGDPIAPEVHETHIEGNARRDGWRYTFSVNGISGYLEFGVRSVWVVVLESSDPSVECRAYLQNKRAQ